MSDARWYAVYDPIQGQGQGAPEVPKIALFKVYRLRHSQSPSFTMEAGI